MMISEPKIENSGIPQGCFLKKSIYKKENGYPYDWSDFNLGMNFEIYSRTFRITSADDATRSF